MQLGQLPTFSAFLLSTVVANFKGHPQSQPIFELSISLFTDWVMSDSIFQQLFDYLIWYVFNGWQKTELNAILPFLSSYPIYPDQPHLPDLDPLFRPLVSIRKLRRTCHGELADCGDFAVVGPSFLLARQQFDEKMGWCQWDNFLSGKKSGQMSLAQFWSDFEIRCSLRFKF